MKKIKLLLILLYSLIFINTITEFVKIEKNSFILIIIFLIAINAIKKYFEKDIFKSRRERIIYTIFSYIFILLYTVGKYMELNNLTLLIIMKLMFISILLAIILSIFIPKIIEIYKKIFKSNNKITFQKSDMKNLFIYILVLFLCWMPVLIAYYPGIFSYDVYVQIGKNYTNFQPILHSFILNLFYDFGFKVGSVTFGMFLYTIFQMIIFSCSLSYVLLFMKRIGINNKVIKSILLFFGLVPIFSILSISITKDIIFTSFVAILCTNFAYYSTDSNLVNNKKINILTIVSIIGTCFFRNNGKYVIILLLIMGILLLKENRKKILSMIFISFIFFSFSNKCLIKILNAQKGPANEMLSIPYQQIASVYYFEKNNLTKNEKKDILEIIPDVKKYNYSLSDPVKTRGRLTNNIKKSAKIYKKYLFKYPIHYVEAFIRNIQGFWYIDDVTNSEIYGKGNNRQGYLLTDTKKGFNVKHKSYFPVLENIYEKLFSFNKYQDIPIISIIFSLSIYIWIILLLFMYSIKNKQKNVYFVYSFIFLLLLTILAGPCALIRYALPYIVCVPIFLTISNINKKENN